MPRMFRATLDESICHVCGKLHLIYECPVIRDLAERIEMLERAFGGREGLRLSLRRREEEY